MATSVDETHPSTVAAITTANQTTNQQPAPAPPPPLPVAEPLPRAIEDFDKLIAEDVKSFVEASENLGDLVEQQVFLLLRGSWMLS